jgi:hypothetical protein
MGQYISLHVRFTGAPLPTTLLRPAFADTSFQPVALGGIDAHQSGDNWFLAGYALEDFVERFLPGSARRPRRPQSIHVAAAENNRERAYLEALANCIELHTTVASRLSPFETENESTGVISMQPVAFDVSVLADCEQWLTTHTAAVLYLYGSLHMAAQDGHDDSFRRAFRPLLFSEDSQRLAGTPFLFVRAGASRLARGDAEVMLYSDSSIWLQQANALDGRISQQDADENLARYASLARSIASAPGLQVVRAELNVEGRQFHEERARIELALAGILTEPLTGRP